MERLKFKLGDVAQAQAVVQASQLYGPQEAVREYVTNALDAIKLARKEGYRGRTGIVTIGHSIAGRTIRVDDDARGMNETALRALPESVWDSAKRGGYIGAGEKGIGLLAFGSVGDSVSIISRDGPGAYNHLRFEKDERGSQTIVVPSFERVSEQMMDEFYSGGFEHGTRVIMSVSPIHLRGRLAPRALERFMQQTYAPLLMRGNPSIWFDEEGKNLKQLEGPSYKGELLVSGTIPFVAGTKGAPVDGSAQIYLMLDSDSDRGAIALHERDVRIWESLAGQEERLDGLKLWTCPHVFGFVNTTGLVTTQDRDGIVRENRGYNNFLEHVVQHLETLYGPRIAAQTDSLRELTQRKLIRKAYDLVINAYDASGEPLNKQVRIHTHPPGSVTPPQPGNKGTHHGGRGGQGGGTRKRVCPQIPIKVREFDTNNDHLRVRLDEMLEEPVIAINSAHSAYREAASAGGNVHTNYLRECIAYGIASVEMREALEKQGKFSGAGVVDVAHEVHTRAQNISDATRRGGKR